MLAFNIEKVGVQGLDKLLHISIETFIETFSAQNTKDHMAAYLNERFSKAGLSSELENNQSRFYFAVFQNKPIGYLKINCENAQTEPMGKTWVEIERLYVLAAFQGKRVGHGLMQTAIDTARGIYAEYLWLGVWENNHQATAFYVRHGFLPFDSHIFMLGNDPQRDILMKRKLP